MPRLCNYENCRKRACYALTYSNPDRCKKHKEHRKGQFSVCKCGKTQPRFNEPGETQAICCNQCKTDTMIDVKNKKCKCGKSQPIYNEPGETHAICCSQCKTDTMVNVKDKRCKANSEYYCGIAGNRKYKGYCTSCFQQLFPKDPLTFQIRSKTKELAVRDFININFDGWQHDKPLFTNHCECDIRRRIDHRVLIGNSLLVVETDENQHKSYDVMDEEIRYDDLMMAYSGKWIYIRFNPDKHKSKSGKKKSRNFYTIDRIKKRNRKKNKKNKK